jgi:hypothetical protein
MKLQDRLLVTQQQRLAKFVRHRGHVKPIVGRRQHEFDQKHRGVECQTASA